MLIFLQASLKSRGRVKRNRLLHFQFLLDKCQKINGCMRIANKMLAAAAANGYFPPPSVADAAMHFLNKHSWSCRRCRRHRHRRHRLRRHFRPPRDFKKAFHLPLIFFKLERKTKMRNGKMKYKMLNLVFLSNFNWRLLRLTRRKIGAWVEWNLTRKKSKIELFHRSHWFHSHQSVTKNRRLIQKAATKKTQPVSKKSMEKTK